MAHKIINNEQFEFWNEGIGQWWVEEDDSMNERLSILTKEGEPLVVQTEGDSNVKVGDTVKVGFSSSRCHIFGSSGEAFK